MNSNLGRGLKDLFKENKLDEILDGEVIVNVDINLIDPNPFQPRKKFNLKKLNELMLSIEEHGILQPIILTKLKSSNRYQIISGERRFRASKELGFESIPAIVRDYSINDMAELALIENIQREDLTAIEEAEAYKNIIEKLNYTQKEVADKVGKSRSYITNILGLLNLDDEIKKLILDDSISMGHARVLSKLENKTKAKELAQIIKEKNLSVRQIEELAKKEEKKNSVNRKSKETDYKDIEEILKRKYNASIKIKDDSFLVKSDDKEIINSIIVKLL